MTAATLSGSLTAGIVPIGQKVSSILDRICQEAKIEPPRQDDEVPVWPEEEALAFERVINESFERIEESNL